MAQKFKKIEGLVGAVFFVASFFLLYWNEVLSAMPEEYKLWVFRGVGFLMMWVGLFYLFGIFSESKPVGRGILGFVTFVVAAVFSGVTVFVSALFHSVAAVAIAVAITLLVVVYFLKRESHGKSALKP